jgi:hypothetical protein
LACLDPIALPQRISQEVERLLGHVADACLLLVHFQFQLLHHLCHLCLTGDDHADEEIKAVIDAYAKSIDDADINLASEIWSSSEEASFIHPRGHERGWEQVKRNFYEVTMGAWFSERKLKVHNVVIRMYRDTAWAEFYWDFVAKFRKDGSPLTTQERETQSTERTTRGGASCTSTT